jgi:xanthine dehydrogenase accessory factor
MSLRFHETVLAWSRLGRRLALVTLVDTVGSTPRKPGARMIVSEGLELYGTIGGGCVEADAILAAREVIRTQQPRLLRVDIKAKNADEMDMLCGGEVTLFIEPVRPDCQLLICGGGHIAKALVHVCEGLDFRVVVVDDREPFAHTERFPSAQEVFCAPYPTLAERIDLGSVRYAVVVTRGHSGDESCLRQLLSAGVSHIAMIGSRTKWTILRARLAAEGFSEEQLARVHSPAGLDIGSTTPEEIAVSVAASLIASRAGKEPPPRP